MTERIISNEDKLKCVERELRMRRQVYEYRVKNGTMTIKQSNYEIACMSAIVEDYRELAKKERLL